jgi:hypothetical protein
MLRCNALEIMAGAKRRLAEEYEAAQDKGEVQGHGGQGKRDIPVENIPSVSGIGLTSKEIHEGRLIRDAQIADPALFAARDASAFARAMSAAFASRP